MVEWELIRSGEDKKDRDLLSGDTVLFTKRVYEHKHIRKDLQVLKNARGDEMMTFLGTEAVYKGQTTKYAKLFHSRNKLGMNSRFNAIDGHEYDFHIKGFSTEQLDIRQTDGDKEGDVFINISYQPLLKQKASEPHRATVTILKPEVLLDESGNPTELLEELIAYWFAFESYIYEIRLSQSGITYGATAMMASGPAAGVC